MVIVCMSSADNPLPFYNAYFIFNHVLLILTHAAASKTVIMYLHNIDFCDLHQVSTLHLMKSTLFQLRVSLYGGFQLHSWIFMNTWKCSIYRTIPIALNSVLYFSFWESTFLQIFCDLHQVSTLHLMKSTLFQLNYHL
jgi:hypothetical protein